MRVAADTGYSIDGGYAEYAVANAHYAVPVPEGVPPIEASALTCAGVMTYKAVKVGNVRPADRVAIFGVGGLGHLAIRYARIAGGFVTAVDIEPGKLDLARDLGAEDVVDASVGDPAEAIQAQRGADVAIVPAAAPSAFEQALRSLRRDGRLLCVGIRREGSFRSRSSIR